MTSRGREVVARLLVGLLVEAHHQMLEEVAHLEVVDAVGCRSISAIALTIGEEPVAGVELLDLVLELEPLEDLRAVGEKPLM